MRLSLAAALVAAGCTASPVVDTGPAPGPPRPNVVLFLADDQGWSDLSLRGHARLETPHLDALAADGLLLDRHYAAAPVCSPTRASLLTGRHPARLGIPGANSGSLPDEETTLAELLRDAGYRTGFFGKWHLGTLTTTEPDSNRGGPGGAKHFSPPARHGFDVAFATEAKVPTYDPMRHPDTGEAYGTAYWDTDGARVTANLDGDDSRVVVDRVVPFVRDAVAAEEPFLAVVWFHSPHLPLVQDPAWDEAYADVEDATTRAYYGCLAGLDEQVGRVRALLDELGVADDTLVWYGSDNGPEGAAGKAPGTALPLRGRKRDLLEGGVRVPGMVAWPARIAPGGRTAAPVSTSDVLPTIAALLELRTPGNLDGADVSGVWLGTEASREGPIDFVSRQRAARIEGRWKVHRRSANAPWSLYDLEADVGEATDLTEQMPERAAAMVAAWESWRADVEADAADAHAAVEPAPPPPEPESPDVFVAVDGEALAGVYELREVRVPAGVTATVEDDCVIRASEVLVIEGTLRAADRGERAEAVAGPSITLDSESTVRIVGEVLGGRGSDGTAHDAPGGAGSDVYLMAPVTVVDGRVVAGDAGDARRAGLPRDLERGGPGLPVRHADPRARDGRAVRRAPIGVAAPSPLATLVANTPWLQPGEPVPVTLPIPPSAGLVGQVFHAQGLLASANGGALTEGQAITVGG